MRIRQSREQVAAKADGKSSGIIRLGVAVLLGAMGVAGAVYSQAPQRSDPAAAKRVAQNMRREWVKRQIEKLVPDARARREILAQVDRLPDEQVQEIAVLCLDELESRRKQQLTQLQEVNARARAEQSEAQRRLADRPHPAAAGPFYTGYPPPLFLARPLGFLPVITWLPEGTSLSAHAVVAPDGRHVRMSLAPFFSTIGPVHTFNFMTGETRRYDP